MTILANRDIANLNGPAASLTNNRLFDQLLILAIAVINVLSERVTLMPHCDCAVLVTQTGEDIPKSPKCHSIIQRIIVAQEPNTLLPTCPHIYCSPLKLRRRQAILRFEEKEQSILPSHISLEPDSERHLATLFISTNPSCDVEQVAQVSISSSAY